MLTNILKGFGIFLIVGGVFGGISVATTLTQAELSEAHTLREFYGILIIISLALLGLLTYAVGEILAILRKNVVVESKEESEEITLPI